MNNDPWLRVTLRPWSVPIDFRDSTHRSTYFDWRSMRGMVRAGSLVSRETGGEVDPLKRGDGCRIETMSSSLESLWYIYFSPFFLLSAFVSPRRCVRAHRNFSISFYFFFSFPLFARIQANTGIRWLIGGSGLVSPCLFLIARTSAPKYRNSNSVVAKWTKRWNWNSSSIVFPLHVNGNCINAITKYW